MYRLHKQNPNNDSTWILTQSRYFQIDIQNEGGHNNGNTIQGGDQDSQIIFFILQHINLIIINQNTDRDHIAVSYHWASIHKQYMASELLAVLFTCTNLPKQSLQSITENWKSSYLVSNQFNYPPSESNLVLSNLPPLVSMS